MVNPYLSSIQSGIQTAHCIADMFAKYKAHDVSCLQDYLYRWAGEHKTIIVLNGGNCAELQQRYSLINDISRHLHLPCGYFAEDSESLNGALTCIGVVVPAYIYEYAATMRGNSDQWDVTAESNLNEKEIALATLINSCQLAR